MSNILSRIRQVTTKEWLMLVILFPITLPLILICVVTYATLVSMEVIMQVLFGD